MTRVLLTQQLFVQTTIATPYTPLQTRSNTLIISNTNCVESISTDTPLPIQDFQSSVLDSQSVVLSWKSPLPYYVFATTIQHATKRN